MVDNKDKDSVNQIQLSEYLRRRKNVMQQMGSDSIAIIPAGQLKQRSNDTDFPFRQNSNFNYLCGFPESDALLVLVPGREKGKSLLFCKEKILELELWDGFLHGPEQAKRRFGIDDAFCIDSAEEIIPSLMEGREKIFYSMGDDEQLDYQVNKWMSQLRLRVRSGEAPPSEIIDMRSILHELRLHKNRAEIGLIKKACNISVGAHIRAMKQCKTLSYEYQLQAEIEHEFAFNRATPAYNSIVGSGANACTLHYVTNQAALSDGDLILIDAGAEYNGYASDITRTFPYNGKFNKEQRAIYELVLKAQLEAIDSCQVGNSFMLPHQLCVDILTTGLIKLGLLKGNVKELVKNGAYLDFYPHRAGHWMGMDVHDVGDYKIAGKDSDWRNFEAGMVTTIEPGIYIQPNNNKVAKKWRGIGVRIEDDILITNKGPEVLTDKAPKQMDEIEALMNS